MRRRSVLAFAAVLAMGTLVPVWAQRIRERAVSPEGMARDLTYELKDARKLLDKVLGDYGGRTERAREREVAREREADQRDLRASLERAERVARELEREIVRLRGDVRGSGGERYLEAAMSDRDFKDLTDSVKRRSFAAEKVSLIRMVAQSDWFTTRQLRELLGLVTFSGDQESVAVAIYPHLVDKARFYTLNDAFRFSSSWKTVCQKLGLPN